MKRIILFRFHEHPVVCRNRLELLIKYNLGVEIFGLFGGPEEHYNKFKKRLSRYLRNIYCIRDKTRFWKWKNGDLAVRLWYDEIGRNISFDMLHLIEWDLLLLDSLDNIYKDIPKNGVGLTALTPIENIREKWNWAGQVPYRKEFEDILGFVKKRFNYKLKPYGCQGPGLCLPKSFLEAYGNIEVPELCNDEIRVPLFSQVLDFKIYDTGFLQNWSNNAKDEVFHCQLHPEVSFSIVDKELANPQGRRVFHPFRRTLILGRDGRNKYAIRPVIENLAFYRKKIFHFA